MVSPDPESTRWRSLIDGAGPGINLLASLDKLPEFSECFAGTVLCNVLRDVIDVDMFFLRNVKRIIYKLNERGLNRFE